jgi:hypothetical protein
MNAQGAAATGEAEETTPERTPDTPLSETVKNPARLGAVLEEMGLPAEIVEQVAPKAERESEGGEEQPPGEGEEQPEQPAEEGQPSTEEPQLPPAAQAEQEEPVPEDWPASAKARVAKEAQKRRARTEELTATQARLAQVEAALRDGAGRQGASPPTMRDPLADVMDAAGLARAEEQFEALLEFAEMNPDGADDVFIGRNPDGSEKRMDYTAQDIAKMKVTAEKVLRKGIPAKAQWLAAAGENVRETQKMYPSIFKDGSEESQTAALILNQLPEIQRFPDFALWIGDAIAGRKARLAKGKRPVTRSGKPLSAAAEAILTQPRVPVAPGTPNGRSPERRATGAGSSSGVDKEQARKEFAERGYSSEALEDFITKSRQAQARGRGPLTRTLA